MRVGTKSLLFGIHQFILHPIMLAMAWKRLYGFPKSFQLWMCFFLHDIGYFGKADMDGIEEGQTHPELGARIIGKLFGENWEKFCLYHSRFYSKTNNKRHSKLCVADKLAFCFYPPKLYCFLARISGEMAFYREFSHDANEFPDAYTMTDLEWYFALKRYTLRVVVKTNQTYQEHGIRVGLDYHQRSYIHQRIVFGSTRGKTPTKPTWETFESCRLHERSRRIAREQFKLTGLPRET